MLWWFGFYRVINVERVLFKISGEYTDVRLSNILYTFEICFTIYFLHVIFPVFLNGGKKTTYKNLFFMSLLEPNWHMQDSKISNTHPKSWS